jgi:hypothetical protein
VSGAAADGAEQRPLGIVAQASSIEIRDEIFLQVVMAGHLVPLAAFLAQAHPEPAVLCEHIFNRHAERRADPRERIDHERDQRAVAQPRMDRDIDAVEQRALQPDRAPAFVPT